MYPGNGRRASAPAWRLGEWKGSSSIASIWPSSLPRTGSESLPAAQAGEECSVQEYYDLPLSLAAIAFARHGRPRCLTSSCARNICPWYRGHWQTLQGL